jgi:hypothetical protein
MTDVGVVGAGAGAEVGEMGGDDGGVMGPAAMVTMTSAASCSSGVYAATD